MRAARAHRRATSQYGVGLIEVLVAVLVLSIGFLGMGALLARSMSTNNSSMARSMATIASYSILDAMRADSRNAKQGAYNTDSPITTDACPTDTDTLAKAQLAQWCDLLKHSLGAASSTSGQVDCQSDGTCAITITFDDSRAGDGGSDKQQLTTRAML